MLTLAWLVLGLLLAAVYIALVRRFEPAVERRLIALGLVIAALIYVAFAIALGNSDWLLIEALGVICYGLIAWLGIRFSGLWLAVGWGAHPLWDALLHLLGPGTGVAPTWYAVACISFDVLIGFYVIGRHTAWIRLHNFRMESS